MMPNRGAGNGNAYTRALAQGETPERHGLNHIPAMMQVLLRKGPNAGITVTERAVRMPGSGEVLVKVAAAGLCGSDILRLQGKDMRESEQGGQHFNKTVLGHEFTGTVVAVGAGVEGDTLMGKAFAVAPLKPCHSCPCCQDSKFSQCGNYSFLGSREDGAFAQYVVVPAHNLVPLPPGVTPRMGALLEPLTCVLHPLMQAGFYKTDGSPHAQIESALVTGPGAIGLLATQVLHSMGVKSIVMTGTRDEPLSTALRCGASAGYNIRTGSREEFIAMLEQRGRPSLVFDASGDIETALQAVADGGTILVVGKPDPAIMLNQKSVGKDILRKELVEEVAPDHERRCTVRGSQMSYGYGNVWPGLEWTEGLRLIASGAVSPDLVLDRVVGVDEAVSAIDRVLAGEKPIKLLFEL